MTHKYTLFDTVPLPENNPTQTHDPNGMRSSLRSSIGGLYDALGSVEGKADIRALPVNGVYVGEVEYLVDDVGDYLVDDVGDYLIAADAQTSLRSQVSELRAKIRQRGTLWRVRLDDESVLEWKTARLLGVRQLVTRDNPVAAAELACEFETLMTNWHAETVTTASLSTTAGIAGSLIVENAGDTVNDAVVTVTRTSGTIIAVTITCAALGVAWTWTGSLGAADVLTIDTGAHTIIKTDADAYSGFSLSGHTARDWLPITQGNHLFLVTVVGGNATVAVSHYTQFA